jgi:ABC-type dipeptide/oligopeptide/nickel transport system permease component
VVVTDLTPPFVPEAQLLMFRFFLRRLLLIIPPLFVVTLVSFLVLRLAPGDPATNLLGPLATPQQVAQVKQELGLDRSLPMQYLLWLWRAVHLDFGTSYVRHVSALDFVAHRLLTTLLLVAAALTISTLVGLAGGLIGAAKRGSIADRGAMLTTLVGLSLPDFWIGLMLILLFSVTFTWLPAGGVHAPGSNSPWDVPSHLLLPAITLSGATMAVMARVSRTSLLEELDHGFVLTAEAKGVPPRRIFLVHVLRNALIPIVTLIGLQLSFMLSSDIITEYVFSWPGIGAALIDAVTQRDYPVIQTTVVLVAVLYMLVNIAIDLLYYVLDPRVRRA